MIFSCIRSLESQRNAQAEGPYLTRKHSISSFETGKDIEDNLNVVVTH
jgi:hypothetical protein